MTVPVPVRKPARPFFSSGPCAKPPGYSPDKLATESLGRSHRAKIGKTRLQHFAHQVDAVLQARLADLGAVRAAERFGCQFVGGISGRLGAGTGRKVRTRRLARRHRKVSQCSLSLQRARAALGPRGPPAPLEMHRGKSSDSTPSFLGFVPEEV